MANLDPDMGLTFLPRGQGSCLQQNNPQELTSFEAQLAKLALDRAPAVVDVGALTCIVAPPGYPLADRHGEEGLYYYLDWACLLLERYA